MRAGIDETISGNGGGNTEEKMKTTVHFEFSFIDTTRDVMPYVVYDTIEHDRNEPIFDLMLKALMEITKTESYQRFTIGTVDTRRINVRFFHRKD
jgi:hypothetical protein